MKLVEVYIARKQAEFARHPFFTQLQGGWDFPETLNFAPDLTFWVMAFQDVLRLNATLTRDPEIRRIVRHHRAEDAGHEQWFLDDLAMLKVNAPDARWLFGKHHRTTRDAAYALVSEVFRANDDHLRLVLVQTLESAGHIFFGRVSDVVERAGRTDSLKYFSFSHLEVEKNHEVFEREISEKVAAMRLSPAVRAEAEGLVDRCYAAFDSMFHALCAPSFEAVAQATQVAAPRPRLVRARAR